MYIPLNWYPTYYIVNIYHTRLLFSAVAANTVVVVVEVLQRILSHSPSDDNTAQNEHRVGT